MGAATGITLTGNSQSAILPRASRDPRAPTGSITRSPSSSRTSSGRRSAPCCNQCRRRESRAIERKHGRENKERDRERVAASIHGAAAERLRKIFTSQQLWKLRRDVRPAVWGRGSGKEPSHAVGDRPEPDDT